MKEIGGQPFHTVGDKYVTALAEVSALQPILIPNISELIDARDLLDQVDGLMMTGSPSNVHPSRYGAPELEEKATPFDRRRDAVTLDLIQAALDRGLPLLCICRGFQELNVVMGGTLFPRVYEIEGRFDHRSPDSGDMSVEYAPRHPLHLEPGGFIAGLLGRAEIAINSLHHQAVDRLGAGLAVEGRAPDGTIEAVRVTDAKDFALGVQWHPEYRASENPDSVAIFRAFGDAVRARQARRLAGRLTSAAE